MFWTQEVRRSRDVLEAECSRSIDVVRRRMNLSNKLWEILKEKSLDQVSVTKASLRLVEYDEANEDYKIFS
ncbi:hypothetical protein A2U01_0073894 [Trifolium medium]|uniref:Uncharacterized protein n=1 Tax=Trifolium medium TaxID=97028 RepID=A0A392SUV0_9FABA|nr:hypothetical protein [Trifolium medium]